MTINFSKKAEKGYKKLSLVIKKKADKQFKFLRTNPHHPSLNVKKMQGEDYFEARIDYHYRFRFFIEKNTIFIITVGPHDEGLGKK